MTDTITAAHIRTILRQCSRIAEAADDLRRAGIAGQPTAYRISAYRILEDVINETVNRNQGRNNEGNKQSSRPINSRA